MSKELTVFLKPVWEADYISASELRLYDCGHQGERFDQALTLLDADECAIKEFVEKRFQSDGDVILRSFQMGPGSIPRGFKMSLHVRDEENGKDIHSSILTFNPSTFDLFDQIAGNIRFANNVPGQLKNLVRELVSQAKPTDNPLILKSALSGCFTYFPLSRYCSEYPEVTNENLFVGVVRHTVLKAARFSIKLEGQEKFEKKKMFFFRFDWGFPNLHPRHSYLDYTTSLFMLYDNTVYAGDWMGGHGGNEYYGLLKFRKDKARHTFYADQAGFGKPLADNKKAFVVPTGEIPSKAYKDNQELTAFSVPDTVKTIGLGAFENCPRLASVDIPGSVTSIGWSAFKGCQSLTSLVIPESVLEIGLWAFQKCTALKSVVLPRSLAQIQAGTFFKCTALDSVVIPPQATTIGHHAFAECTSLTSLTIQGPVEKIEEQAFGGCSSLKTLSLPAGIKKFHKTAFEGCTSIEYIEVPATKGEYYKKRLPESLHPFITERPA